MATASTAVVLRDWHPYPRRNPKGPNEHEARMLAQAYVEGAYFAANAIACKVLPVRLDSMAFARHYEPSFVHIRNFLIGDWDCDPIIAARVALACTTPLRKVL